MPDTLYQIGNFLYDKDMVAKIYFVMLILIILSFVHARLAISKCICLAIVPLFTVNLFLKKSTAAILQQSNPSLPTSNHIPNQK